MEKEDATGSTQAAGDISACSSFKWPSEGAVGFEFSDPRGVERVVCQGKKKKRMGKKHKEGNRQREGGWNSETEEEGAKTRRLTGTFTAHYITVLFENTPLLLTSVG